MTQGAALARQSPRTGLQTLANGILESFLIGISGPKVGCTRNQ